MTRKSAAPDSLRLLVDPLQKASPAFGDLPRKNVQVKQLPVAFFPPTARPFKWPAATTRKSAAQDCLRLLVDPPRESSSPSEMYPEKMFMPDYLRLPFHTDREAPQVACCDDPKKCSSRLPSAFGRSPAKSLSSLWKCTLKKCSCRTTFGCLSTPTARLLK